MRERREYVRCNGLVLVNFKMPDESLEGKSSAFDICGTGLRITVDKEIKLGTAAEVEIYLPGNSRPIVAKGETVWLEKCEKKTKAQPDPKKEYFFVGLRFTKIDENSRSRILNYVFRKTKQYNDPNFNA
ncbi:PilZ domain-containing protein [Candidatus Omnitrophota bacterium]